MHGPGVTGDMAEPFEEKQDHARSGLEMPRFHQRFTTASASGNRVIGINLFFKDP